MRFKEDQDAWQINSLKILCKFTGGGTPSTSNTEFWNGTIPWISSADLFEDTIHSYSISRHITREAIENSSTKLCPPNSILIVSRVGLGKVAISNEFICTSQDFTNITKFSIDKVFLAYSIKQIIENLKNASQGTSIKGITSKEIKEIRLSYPSINIQSKIGCFLSKIDNLIDTQSKIIEQIKSQIKSISHIMCKVNNDTVKLKEVCVFENKTNHQSGEGLSSGKYVYFTDD